MNNFADFTTYLAREFKPLANKMLGHLFDLSDFALDVLA
jgi:hypothetical protein